MTDYALIQKILDEQATGRELELFRERLLAMDEREYALLIDEYLNRGEDATVINPARWQDKFSLQVVMEKINATKEAPEDINSPVHRVHFLKTAWFRYAAAVIIIAGIGAYLWSTRLTDKQKSHPLTYKESVPKEILPGGNNAILTLADGSTIVLDSAANGQLARQEGSTVTKKDGQLIYDANQVKGTGVTYNTMRTPKGGQYQLALHDGTKVWLNAASSITYPTAFTGKTREVTITGEAYFEVAKNSKQPFIVKTDKEEITVLGTAFNVNAYSEEEGKTSLLEGSIKIFAPSRPLAPLREIVLTPGQAFINGKLTTTNLSQDIAWKNGVFDFNNLSIQQAMKQLERWYDIEVVYDKPVNETFIGEVGRNLSLSQVLKTLEGLGVHFRLEGRTLHVFP